MPKSLTVRVLKDQEVFLEGVFEVPDNDYVLVKDLLPQAKLDKGQAASILSGYMHASDAGTVTEEVGKVAMVAAVYMMEEGEDAIEIPLETVSGAVNPY